MPAEQERALRRLCRIRLAIRLVVYGGLALVLVAVIAGARRDARGATAATWLDAETSQGHWFELMLRDGQPVHFDTRLDAPCGETLQIQGKLRGPYGPYTCDSGFVSFVSG